MGDSLLYEFESSTFIVFLFKCGSVYDFIYGYGV